MCRLLGVAANSTVYLTFSLLLAPNSLRSQSRENPHGWGIAAYKGGWSLWKEAYSAEESTEFEKRSHEASGNIIISHLRKATVGQKTLPNTHPFHHANWMLAHNGTVRNSRNLKVGGEFLPKGNTDSERIFCALLSDLQEHCEKVTGVTVKDVEQSLHRVVRQCLLLDPACKINLVFSDGSLLYVFRHGHPLFWLVRESRSRESLQSKTMEMQEQQTIPGEKAVLVATEILTSENWQEVVPDRLLFADPNNVEPGLQRVEKDAKGAIDAKDADH